MKYMFDILFNNLDNIALVTGTIGTILWAHNGIGVKYVSVWWLVSSFFWVAFAYRKDLTALGIRDLISVSLYLYGFYRHIFCHKNVKIPNYDTEISTYVTESVVADPSQN